MSASGSTYREGSPSSTNRSSRTSTTSASTNRSSCHSQEYGKNQRSKYRLFPIVEPTPPASPFSLISQRRISVSGGATGRRSISLGPAGSRRASGEPSHLVPRTPNYNSSRPTTPELRSLVTVEECDGQRDSSITRKESTSATNRTFNARDAFARSQRVVKNNTGEPTANGNATEKSTTTISTSDPVGLGLQFPRVPANGIPKIVRGRAKSKPNLRIAVFNAWAADGALAVSAASPEPPQAASSQITSVEAVPLPPSPYPPPPTRKAPGSPDAVHASGIAASGTGGSSREPSNSSLIAKQATPCAARGQLRPTSHACGGVSGSSSPETPIASFSQAPALRRLVRVASLPSPKLRAMTCDGYPGKPYFVKSDSLSPPNISVRSVLPSLDSRFARRAETTDSLVLRSFSNTDVNSGRPFTSQGISAKERLAASPLPNMPGLILPHTPDSPDWRTESTALSAARAKVAALRNAASPVGSIGLADATQANGDIASHKASCLHSDSDPAYVLECLDAESEALNARQANLRTDRQRLSNGIIANLKNPQTTPEFLSQMLNDQLALAAINSSMDICWAKMKSLECRREDAVAALLGSAQHSRQPSDSITSMIATMALSSRKPSLTRSFDSTSQVGFANGRSAPDPRYNRYQTPSARNISQSSDADSLRSRLSVRGRKDRENEKLAIQSGPSESLSSAHEIREVGEEDDPVSACLSSETDLEDMFNTADGDVPKTVQEAPEETQKIRVSSGGAAHGGGKMFGLRGVKSMQTLPRTRSSIFQKTESSKRPESPASQTSAILSKPTVFEMAEPSKKSPSIVPQTTAPLPLRPSASISNIRTTTLLHPRAPPTQYTALSSNPLTPKLPEQTFEPASAPVATANEPTLPLRLAGLDTPQPASEMARFSILESADLSIRDLDLQLMSFPAAPVRATPELPSAPPPAPPSNTASPLPPRSSSRLANTPVSPLPPTPPPKDDNKAATRRKAKRETQSSHAAARKETERSARTIRKFMARESYA